MGEAGRLGGCDPDFRGCSSLSGPLVEVPAGWTVSRPGRKLVSNGRPRYFPNHGATVLASQDQEVRPQLTGDLVKALSHASLEEMLVHRDSFDLGDLRGMLHNLDPQVDEGVFQERAAQGVIYFMLKK